jgi:response regulator RpfG family c-di-GMP phosphodiesterase
MKQARPRVLCVDDEPHVLEGLTLHLRRAFEVHTATSGAQGLEALGQNGPFAVALSDMRMPEMNGAAFLARVQQKAPDTVRMLLTGYADLQSAIVAVNEGQIFRFLTKPCPPDQLRLAFDAAAEQHRLVTAERDLLEQTLLGSIKTLADILSMTNPIAFGRAMRIKQHVSELADGLGLRSRWQVKVAAVFSQLGAISLPEETAEKYYYGKELSVPESAMVARMPGVAEELLANIPRLEPVREILAQQGMRFENGGGEGDTSFGARILKIAVEFDELESGGLSPRLALETMRAREGWYDPQILEVFAQFKGAAAEQQEVQEVPLKSVRVGMVFAEDVQTRTGVILVTRGFEVTPSFAEKLRNFRKGWVNEPLRVLAQKGRNP